MKDFENPPNLIRTRKGAEHEYEDLRSVMTGGGNRQLPSTAASQVKCFMY